MKNCIRCGSTFQPKNNCQKYCCEECRKESYRNYRFYSSEATLKYREKIKEEEGIDDTDFNYKYREKTASNRGMTTTEYNSYLESNKAKKLGISIQKLRHLTYIAKKNHTSLCEELGMNPSEYYKRLKRKI